MWIVLTCIQGHRRGVITYRPHNIDIARNLANEILMGVHPNGDSPQVQISCWRQDGKLMRSRTCNSTFDIEKWYDYETGCRSEGLVWDEMLGRIYTPFTFREVFNFPYSAVRIETVVHGECVAASRINNELKTFMEKFVHVNR